MAERPSANAASKLEELKVITSTITRLETELATAKEEQRRLESELASYSFIASPISRLPTEILVKIFQEYVTRQPTHIRRLLLVSRQWTSIVENTPHLWTQIRIVISKNLDQPKSLLKYVQRCLERSHNRLLDVWVDYQQFDEAWMVFLGLLKPVFKFSAGDKYFYKELPVLISTKFDSPRYTEYIESCGALPHLLVGPNGQHMNRFRSLSLVPSYSKHLRDRFLQAFSYSTPHLTQLSVTRGSSEYDMNGRRLFPELTALSHLAITPGLGWTIDFSTCPLVSLDAETTDGFEDCICRVFAIKSLQYLTLRFLMSWDKPKDDELAVLRNAHENGGLTLPNLQYLHIYGDLPPETGALLVLPKLQVYRYTVDRFRSEPEPLAALPSTVHWGSERNMDKGRRITSISGLIQHFTYADVLKIHQDFQEEALEAVQMIRVEGIPLPNLKVLRLVNDSGFDERDIEV